jgi:hypothetical protein
LSDIDSVTRAWAAKAAAQHQSIHDDMSPATWRYFQLIRNHCFTQSHVPDLDEESREANVYKTIPLFTLPLTIQAKRMVELGSSFTHYPDGQDTPWTASKEAQVGLVSTRILLSAAELLHDLAGIDAHLTSVDLRERVHDFGDEMVDLRPHGHELMKAIGVDDRWTFDTGIDSVSWLNRERERIEQGTAERIDFALVDSNHTYEQVGAELDGLLPLMSDKGVILVDDCYSTNYLHGVEWVPQESENGQRHGGEFGAILEFVDAHPEWHAEWLQYMCLLRR